MVHEWQSMSVLIWKLAAASYFLKNALCYIKSHYIYCNNFITRCMTCKQRNSNDDIT